MSLLEQYSASSAMPLAPKVYHADGCYKELLTGDCHCGSWRALGARLVPAPWRQRTAEDEAYLRLLTYDHGHNRFGAKYNFRCPLCELVVHKHETAGYSDGVVVCGDCWTCERDWCSEC